VNAGPARILDTLRRATGRSCSGQTLSGDLGVSRAQIWKHVQTLRNRGYEISAEAGDGYRLDSIPDRLYPEEIKDGLATHWLAHRIHYFDSIDSTNRVALELAREGAEHGLAVVAEEQTAGRGRLGRSFHSPAFENLYTSLVLRPDLDITEAPAWILAAAIAVADSVAATIGDDGAVEIKWPNDVLLAGRKTSGILMELGAEATRVDYLVLGIGVNLNVDRKTFPDEFRHLATSLASHSGRRIDRIEFTRRLYTELEATLDACATGGFDAVRDRFEERFKMRGRRVKVKQLDGRELSGTAMGIDADGALRLELEAGAESRVIAGDVTIVKDPTRHDGTSRRAKEA
jgi:BirA family biotin operon repressor/biotin-[acetyl-CoA-carboxylase] ligase